MSSLSHDRLEVVEADVFSAESVLPHFKDVDAVISTLGFSLRTKPDVRGYSQATQAAVDALNQIPESSKRLILMHSWYTKPESRAEAAFLIRLFVNYIIYPVLEDMNRVEEYLATNEDCKDIQWTAVLPPGLSNGAVTGKNLILI